MYPNYNNYYPQQNRYYDQQRSMIMTGQSPQQTQPQFSGLRGRPVASIEEARASIVDFDGSIFYFPDLANNRIYIKQINLDGTSSLYVYEKLDSTAAISPSYVSQEEFKNTVNALLNEIEQLKGEQKYDE